MARKSNYIALELKSLESKINEFRTYLDDTKVKHISDFNERHAEIKVQLLMMKELAALVGQLDGLKKQAEKEVEEKATQELRGDVPLSPLEEGLI